MDGGAVAALTRGKGLGKRVRLRKGAPPKRCGRIQETLILRG